MTAAERLARVRRYLAALGLRRWRAIVFGSVGRGDFTAESDTDLLVVSDELPADHPGAARPALCRARGGAGSRADRLARGGLAAPQEAKATRSSRSSRREGLVLEP
ncbi:MAG: nucleotidyltransferase domain-containing protein [Burkholderiales bacterium]|nr:nucleotidyltransferase domain-containing protein [Burkholderiales bacterium]